MPRKKKSRGRRANGEGSLYQRAKDQRWIYEITFKGESKPRYFSGMTADEAIKKKDEALAILHQSGYIPKKNKLTVGQWMDTWMELYKATDLSDSGRESYEDEIELRIKSHNINNILLSELTTPDVQAWINYLSKHGRADKNGGLSPKTVVRTWGILRQALDKAVEDKLMLSNPAAKKLVKPPKVPKPKIKHMTVENTASFLQDIKDDYMYEAIITDLMTGLRRGELLALMWKDINLTKGTALIRRQLIRAKAGPKLVDRVKTDTGYREIELSPALVEILKNLKQKQFENKLKLNPDLQEEQKLKEKVVELKRKKDLQADDLVFCWPDGRFYNPDHLYPHLQRLLTKHKYDKLSVHGLRHTYATSSIAIGTDLAVLSKNLGHADGATTAIYLHSDREREKAAALKMETALLKKTAGTTSEKTSENRKNDIRKSKKPGK